MPHDEAPFLMPRESNEKKLAGAQAPSPKSTPIGAREIAVSGERSRVRRFFRRLGPGLIAGVADDDPATIGTCASIGASLGYTTLWTMLVTFPLMATIQYMSAKIGLATGLGLGAVVRKHYPRALLYPLLIGVVIANSINAGADLGASAAGINLLVPAVPISALIIPIAAVIVLFQAWGS